MLSNTANYQEKFEIYGGRIIDKRAYKMRKAPQCLLNTTELFLVNVGTTRQKVRRLPAPLNCMLFQNHYVILH